MGKSTSTKGQTSMAPPPPAVMDENKVSPEEEMQEIWDLVQVLQGSNSKDQACRTCQKKAVAVWTSNLAPQDFWPLCEPCQLDDFGGWPFGVEPPQVNQTNAECVTPQLQEQSSVTTKIVETTTPQADRTLDGLQETVPIGRVDTPTGTTDHVVDEEEVEVWHLVKITPLAAVTSDSLVKCSTETCSLPAACAYVSNLAPTTKWYTCLDCQERDFGGWPEDLGELPLTSMTQEHKDALIAKCTRQKTMAMPNFPPSSPQGAATAAVRVSHTTPAATTQDVTTTITPSPAVAVSAPKPAKQQQPSKQALALHRKWLEMAQTLGGPDAKIVVAKPEAKQLIYNLLYDAFAPMNITQIHKALKAVVPSPVLKSCLDEMALDKSTEDQFAESDDEDEGPSSKKKKKKAGNNPVEFALCFKAGRSGTNSNNGLYYVDYAQAKNGNGLDPHDRNELHAQLAKTQGEQAALKNSISTMTTQATKLFAEPTNEEATAQLALAESEMASLESELEEARKLKANEKQKKQVKRRIDNMTTQWRKRRRLCMDFLIAMEENTDGSISVKKALAGDGPLEIDSDEAAAAGAVAYAKKKRARPAGKKRVVANTKIAKNESTVLSDENFVAVNLDSQGCVKRVYVEDD